MSDARLVDHQRQAFSPALVQADGYARVTVVRRFGTLIRAPDVPTPGYPNPSHARDCRFAIPPWHADHPWVAGMGLLLSQAVACPTVARLLGGQPQAERVRSAPTSRTIVRSHGQRIRHGEPRDVAALRPRGDLAPLDVPVVPHDPPRCRAG